MNGTNESMDGWMNEWMNGATMASNGIHQSTNPFMHDINTRMNATLNEPTNRITE